MSQIEITAKEDPDLQEEEQPKAARPRWHYAVLAGVNLFIVGVIAAFIMAGNRSPEAEEPTTTGPVEVDVLGTLTIGDQFLRTGKLKEAKAAYDHAATEPASLSTSLSYRRGVCAEQSGELNDAQDFYNAAAQHDSPNISLAANLGYARITRLRGHLDDSANRLAKLAAVSALPEYATTGIGPEIDYLMAMVWADRALASLPTSIRDPRHLFNPAPPTAIEELLAIAPIEGNQIAPPRRIGDDTNFGLVIHGMARDPSTTLVSVSLQSQQALLLFESLSGKTAWKVSKSVAADEILAAKRIDVHLRDKTAAEMLSLLLEPLGLFWIFENDTLIIDRPERFSQEVRDGRDRKRANDLLQNALAQLPDHDHAPYAYLALGNLAVVEGRFDRALTFYREVGERYPMEDIRQVSDFNRSKVHYIQKELDKAIEGFYGVVDARHGTPLEPLAYLYLGRTFVDLGDLEKAVRTLSRSQAIATDAEVAATTSLTLASVYLMKGGGGAAESANAVLMEARPSLSDKAFHSKAVFLSALTRFQAAFRPGDVRRRKRELTSALMNVDPADFFGDFGYLLVADAYVEVGVPIEAARVYQTGLSRPLPAAMRDRLLFRLATEQRKQNRYELAKNTFLELIAGGSPAWEPLASIELANLYQHNSELAECVRHCRWALERGFSEQHNVQLLRVLGHVYEELGDPERAGHCFAGFLPSSELKIAEAPR